MKDADAVGLTVTEFVSAVEEDWLALGVLYPGHVPAAWRSARLMFLVLAGGGVVGWRLMRRNRSRRSGRPVTAELVTAEAGASITAADPDPLVTATRHGLVIH